MSYEFKVGTSAGSMELLSDLVIYAPAWEYAPYSVAQKGGDGLVKGGGWATANWHWGFITYDMYQTLRTYCPGESATWYIRTPKTTQDWLNVEVKVEWPTNEQWHNSRVLDFELKFTDLTEF